MIEEKFANRRCRLLLAKALWFILALVVVIIVVSRVDSSTLLPAEPRHLWPLVWPLSFYALLCWLGDLCLSRYEERYWQRAVHLMQQGVYDEADDIPALQPVASMLQSNQLQSEREARQISWIMQHIPGGLVAIDRDAVISLYSCPALTGLAIEPVHMVGQNVGAFHRLIGVAESDSLLLDALHNGNHSRCTRLINGHYYEAINSPLYDETGEINGALCLFVDADERIRQEKAVQHLEQMKLVGGLSASLGHEIRNPLAIVRGHLQLLSQQEEQQAFQRQFAVMLEQIDRINGMLEEFLGLAREAQAHRQPASLSSIVQRLHPMLESEARLRDITLELQLEAVPDLELDTAAMQQLLLNLYRNALEATPTGGHVGIL